MCQTSRTKLDSMVVINEQCYHGMNSHKLLPFAEEIASLFHYFTCLNGADDEAGQHDKPGRMDGSNERMSCRQEGGSELLEAPHIIE